MKSSPPFPVRDVVMVPGLLPIFLHGCEIKSGSGLGTRLVATWLAEYCIQFLTVRVYLYAFAKPDDFEFPR